MSWLGELAYTCLLDLNWSPQSTDIQCTLIRIHNSIVLRDQTITDDGLEAALQNLRHTASSC